MDLREQLLLEHSKANSDLIKDYIGNEAERFELLLDLFESDEYRVSQRAAMVISACFDENPEMVKPYRERMILNLFRNDGHVPVKRNTIRIFQFMEVPEEYQAEMFDYCLKKLYLLEEPIAVKAFAMQVACNIVKDYPDLKPELEEAIYIARENNDSAGIRSRSKSVLKQLAKL